MMKSKHLIWIVMMAVMAACTNKQQQESSEVATLRY